MGMSTTGMNMSTSTTGTTAGIPTPRANTGMPTTGVNMGTSTTGATAGTPTPGMNMGTSAPGTTMGASSAGSSPNNTITGSNTGTMNNGSANMNNGMTANRNTMASTCGQNAGSLPGTCASLAFPFVPFQEKNPPRYEQAMALQTGTLFPGLNLPFKAAMTDSLRMNNTALAELMALDFAIDEMGLYLTTHPKDQEVLDLYWAYIKMGQEGREKYTQMYGPLLQTDITADDGFIWLNDPWPWDEGGSN